MTPTTSPVRQRQLLLVGGLVFAAGNLLHPMEHSTTAEQAPTWVLAHVLLFTSSFLLAAGLPVLRGAVQAAGRLGTVGVVAFWAGTLAVLPGSVYEAFIAPKLDGALETEVLAALLPVDLLALPLFVGGGILLGIAALRSGLPRWFGVTWIVASLVLLVGPPAIDPDGLPIIPATAAQGLTIAGLAWRHVRTGPVRAPEPAPVAA